MGWTLITGAAKNLGAAIALALASKGNPVVIHYNRSESDALALLELCRSYGAEAEALHGDLSSPDSVETFIESYLQKFPETSALINNMGNYSIGSFEETPMSQWEALIQTNLLAPIALIKGLLPSIKNTRGTILNIGVTAVQEVRGTSYHPAYKLTKLGLHMLTKSLAKELVPYGVPVNMVSPGYLENSVDLPKQGNGVLFGRPAYFNEVVRAVLFLIDPANAYITGQNLEVAGGFGL